MKLNNECPICGKCSISPSNQYCREHEILNCNTYDKKYIEREAAVKAAKDGADEWDGGYNRNRDSYIECAIDNIPAADVRENVRGEWVINSDGYYPYCSHCKEEPQGHAMTDYCPNCGAQMKR